MVIRSIQAHIKTETISIKEDNLMITKQDSVMMMICQMLRFTLRTVVLLRFI
jgi:hypothetical protein